MTDPIAPDSSAYARAQAEQYWKEIPKTPLNKLRFADAQLARYTVWWSPQQKDNFDWLKSEVGDVIRKMSHQDCQQALGDPHVVGMIRHLFGERGIGRLKARG